MAETKKAQSFSAEERAAMRQRAKELKAAGTAESDAQAEREAIEALTGNDRELAERVHSIVLETAPQLAPKTWYGFPSYALDGNLVCFFQPASKFKARYATLGFSDPANLDDGGMWAVAFAVTKLTAADEKKIAELVKKAVS